MKAILDTAIFLWWISDHSRFSSKAKQYLTDPTSEPLVSAASLWEIKVKTAAGQLHLPEPVDRFLSKQLSENAFHVLPIESRHVLALWHLPEHHQDPFDRMLIAQSQVENIPIVTADPQLSAYEVSILW